MGVKAEHQDSRPFYCSEYWFSQLKKTTEINNHLFTLQFDKYQFPHVVEKKRVFFFNIQVLKSLSNYYTPYFEIKEKEKLVTPDIYNCAVKRFPVIDLSPLTEENMHVISEQLDILGFYVHVYQKTQNWYQSTITSAEDYWQSRPSILVNTINRKRKKAERDPNYKLNIYSSHNTALLERYLIEFHDVYCNSWKVKEPYPDFIDAIARYESERGNLRIGIVYQASMAVAAQIWFTFGNTAYIFKLAYDENYKKEGYGNLLTQALVNFCIENDGIKTIDFLTGNDPYKKDWMDSCRPLYGLLALNKKTVYGFSMIFWLKTKMLIKLLFKKEHSRNVV